MDLFSLESLKQFVANPIVVHLGATLLLLAGVLALRAVLVRSIRRHESLAKEIRRRWLVQIRNGLIFLFILGCLMIWAEELRFFAVSILAVAVATVIATKELIQCFSGSLLRTGSRAFKIGDRIEIAGIRGDVIDHTALTTTVLEVGPNHMTQQLSGRAIVLPNSVFLGKPLVNESFTHDFVLHVFKIPVKMDENWMTAEEDLFEAARAECRPFLDEARKHFNRFSERHGLVSLSVEPRVTVSIPKAGEIELAVRVAVPARRKGRVEQAILRRFLAVATTRAVEKKKAEEEAKAAAAATKETVVAGGLD